jgi:hypothetical protein
MLNQFARCFVFRTLGLHRITWTRRMPCYSGTPPTEKRLLTCNVHYGVAECM